MAMMAITTSSSIRVKPRRLFMASPLSEKSKRSALPAWALWRRPSFHGKIEGRVARLDLGLERGGEIEFAGDALLEAASRFAGHGVIVHLRSLVVVGEDADFIGVRG